MTEFSFKNFAKSSMNGFEVLEANLFCLKLLHKASGRVFHVERTGSEFTVWVASPRIDGPKNRGTFIMRVDSLRRLLLAIGYVRDAKR